MSDFFPLNSRYQTVPLRSRVAADGTIEMFVGRRIIPAMERYGVAGRYRVAGGDRIDRIAADAFGDADPAAAAGPPGRLLVVPLPLEIEDNGDA